MNKSYSTTKGKFATESLLRQWKMKQEKFSPCYNNTIGGVITIKLYF